MNRKRNTRRLAQPEVQLREATQDTYSLYGFLVKSAAIKGIAEFAETL